jgi:hypothetical protein
MSKVGNAVDKIRTKIATKATKFMPDVCSLIPPAMTAQGSGHTLGDGTPITGIPCSHEQAGGGGVTFHDGESEVTKSHRIEMPFTNDTIAISKEYKIKVAARGLNPEFTFEQPVIRNDSMSPLLQVFAVLTEGYRSPGIT